MTKMVRGAALTLITASALVFGGGAALADEASFKECLKANFAAAGPDGAVAGSIEHCVKAHAHS